MQITVKSAKVATTGTSNKGAWSLIVVVAEDTGIEYTTFDKKAHIGAGAVLDIGEPTAKEGKHSFKECTIVKEAPATPQPSGSDDRNGMTPELWAEKDRIKQQSIECQVIFTGMVELAKVRTFKEGTEREVYDAALDWAMEHFKTDKPAQRPTQKTQPEATGSTPGALEADLHSLVFADAGQLKTAMKDVLKMNGTQIAAAVAGCLLATEEGRRNCWSALLKMREEKPTETQKELDPDHIFE